MSHFSRIEYLSEPPDNIKARYSEGFIYEIEHVLFTKFRIPCGSRMIQDSWCMGPLDRTTLEYAFFTKEVDISKVEKHLSDDISSTYEMSLDSLSKAV